MFSIHTLINTTMKYVLAAKDRDPSKPNYQPYGTEPNSEHFFEKTTTVGEYRAKHTRNLKDGFYPIFSIDNNYQIRGNNSDIMCDWTRNINQAKTFDSHEEAHQYKMNIWKIDYDHIYIKPIEL